ncbi:zinc finger domain-containing protein [Streptomyces viridiviolaceus]
MTDPQQRSPADQSDADDVEQHTCPKCDAQPGSPCRSRGGAVASAYHAHRFTMVPRLKKALRVPTPADRGPGRPWQPGTWTTSSPATARFTMWACPTGLAADKDHAHHSRVDWVELFSGRGKPRTIPLGLHSPDGPLRRTAFLGYCRESCTTPRAPVTRTATEGRRLRAGLR